MKKILLASAFLVSTIAINAQSVKVTAGKKLQLETETKATSTVSVMGSDMEVIVAGKSNTDVEVKTVTANAITSTVTLKRVTGTTSAMGQENSFDSDKTPTSNNPMAAEVLKNLNKPEEVILKDGKIDGKMEIGSNGMYSSAEVIKKTFFTVDNANKKEGYKWTEEINADGVKAVTIYTITKLDATDIEVTATTSSKIEKTINQMGMDMKQNLTGTSTSVSVYDAATGILKADATKAELTGTMQVMGNDAPLSVKSVTTTTVK